jgi:hypothetical protein
MLSLVRRLVRVVKPADFFAFLICTLLAHSVASFLPEGGWSVYGSMLVFYHLFLAWLVIDADRRGGLSPPIFSAIMTHLACLTFVIAYGTGRDVIPFFGFLRYAIFGLAVFERNWILAWGKKKKEEVPVTAPLSAAAATTIAQATADDYDAWLQYLATRNPLSRKPGMTIQEEYEQWMVDRAKSRSATS